MKGRELAKIYEVACQTNGFQEDASKAAYSPILDKRANNFHFIQKEGTHNGNTVIITVVGDLKDWDLVRAVHNWQIYNNETQNKPGVKIPKVIKSGNISGTFGHYVIQSKIEGQRLVSGDLLNVFDWQMIDFADLYWQTQVNFPKFDIGDITVTSYFLNRLSKWHKESRDKRMMGHHLVSKGIAAIFDECQPHDQVEAIKMGSFFSHFGFTDIVCADKVVYLLNSEVVPKPEGAGMAGNIWVTLVHASLTMGPFEMKVIINKWINAFIKSGQLHGFGRDHVYSTIRANLIERLIATLMIDIPNGRSPYDTCENDEQLAKAKENILAALHIVVNHS